MKTRFVWLFALCFFAALRGQTPEQTLHFARRQSAEGNIELAAKTWQRLLFFTGDRYREEASAQLARLFFLQNDLEKSAFYFDLLYQSAHNDSVRYEAVFGKTSTLLLRQEFQKCLPELLALPPDLPEPWRSRRDLYLGAAYFGARDFDAAERSLADFFEKSDAPPRQQLSSLMKKARRIDRKNARTARILSTVMPGTGQIYAGDLKNGLNSLLLNAALGFWFARTAQAYSLLDAALTVFPWFSRYYGGGIRHAGEILEEKKTQKLRGVFLRISDLAKKSKGLGEQSKEK